MSYRSDMERFANEVAQRKKHMELIMKITVIALALAIVTGVVATAIAFATGSFSSNGDRGLGGGGGADKRAPVIKGPEGDTAVAYTGETIAYKSFVQVSDNSGQFTLDVDNSKVDANAEGTYTVTYTATDGAGNKSSYKLTLIIKNGAYSETKMLALVAQKAQALGITDSMSTVQKVQAIYQYVNDPSAGASEANIRFTDISNTPAQQSQAGKKHRTGWETDWVEEACRTLSMGRMEGDCFTYYSVSKAFFTYFKIENIGIQRAETSVEKGTHFWSVVNVGTASEPAWYFYDSTRLGSTFSDGTRNACLITESKMKSYATEGFYDYVPTSGFPTLATKPVA